MPGILALAITGAAKTDIYNAVDSKYRQNWYPVDSLLLLAKIGLQSTC